MLSLHSIETFGTYDGPGIRLVLFLQGCNFKCLYCANPDTIEYKGGTEYSVESLVEMAERQRPFFGEKGGVTVSGGEPLMQSEKLINLFKLLKQADIHTCIDTNGSILSSRVKDLLKYTDLVLLDIKHFDEEKHKLLTGKSNTKTIEFAQYLSDHNIPAWIRYVLIPGYSDNEVDLHNLGQFLQTLKNVQKLEIQPYHKLGVHKYKELAWDYKLKDTPLNSGEQLKRAHTIFQQYIKEVVVN